MFRLVPRSRQDDLVAASDEVVLVDGSVMRVPRGNLAAAKELLAARKAAQRRVAARRVALEEVQESIKLIG